MSVVALVPVTGRTGQFGDIFSPEIEQPAFAEFPLLAPVLHNLFAAGCIDLVALVVPSSQVDEFAEVSVMVIGIDEHAFESTYSIVANALPAIPDSGISADVSVVLVHEQRHAFAPPELIRRVVAEIDAGAPAAVPVLPCTDTVKELDEAGVIIATPDRATLRVTQSPVGFAARLWRAEPEPAPWHPLPPGARTVPGHPAARAIRTAFDLAFAKDG
jgi:2-C-methyl-D-erythritol 4-phosphate cytidylyltransferase